MTLMRAQIKNCTWVVLAVECILEVQKVDEQWDAAKPSIDRPVLEICYLLGLADPGRSSNESMNEQPVAHALVTFLDARSGGCETMPDLTSGRYMPHIVIQSPDVRSPNCDGRTILDNYLGIRFVSGPTVMLPNQCYDCDFALMYHPHVDYSAVCDGATFTLREGGRVVGFGSITRCSN
jgi:hypothetical protein